MQTHEATLYGLILSPEHNSKASYNILSVAKLTMEGTKFSFISMALIDFQSPDGSPRSRAMDSMAILTMGGGLGNALTSTRWFFLMPFTAGDSAGVGRVKVVRGWR